MVTFEDDEPGTEPSSAGEALPDSASTPAERALKEAETRRRDAARREADPPKEINGRKGPEPTRYGDWEVNGIASDF